MAKTKIKFKSENKSRKKTFNERGITLNQKDLDLALTVVDVSKDDLYEELGHRWQSAMIYGEKLKDSRRVRVLEKALTAPAFADSLIPLRPNNVDEAMYFMALCKVKDVVLYIQDVLYKEMQASDDARRAAADAAK